MNVVTRARVERRRELIRQGLGPLYDRIHQILLKHNPIGVDIARGDARDDYGLPVGTLIPRLHLTSTRDDLARALFTEMQHWYASEAGTMERYIATADEIWQAWTEFQQGRISN
jgi:hypothetical protein